MCMHTHLPLHVLSYKCIHEMYSLVMHLCGHTYAHILMHTCT